MRPLYLSIASALTGSGGPAAEEKESPEFTRGPKEGMRNVYSEVDGATFNVRGGNYLVDGIKQKSGVNAMDLLEVEMFKSQSGKVENYAERKESAVWRKTAEGDTRFKLMIVFQTTTVHMVVTWAVNEEAIKHDAPFHRMWEEYLDGTSEFRSERLKVIPRVIDGNFLLRRVLGEKPGILGRRLAMRYYKTDHYLEVACDTVSSNFGNKIMSACLDHASKLTIDLGFIFEGRTDEELPERIFGSFRLSKPNLNHAKVLT